MPLSTTYEWRQTDAEVFIDVALKSASITSSDIDVCDVFVKVNQAPYLLTLDLHASIDLDSVAVTIDRGSRIISLVMKKVVCATWPSIEIELPDAVALSERRKASIEARSRYDEGTRAKNVEVRRDREKAALKAQMNLESRQREALETAQESEKKRAQVRQPRETRIMKTPSTSLQPPHKLLSPPHRMKFLRRFVLQVWPRRLQLR
jgi:hypothetical protein